jgi:xylulokinase
MEVVIGIDLGTQGVRAVAVTKSGALAANADQNLPMQAAYHATGLHEQDPTIWWECTHSCLRRLISALPQSTSIEGVCIDSTSGSLVLVNDRGEVLMPAIMYNDTRSSPYVDQVHEAGRSLEQRLGYSFSASFALPKMVWVRHEKPDLMAKPMRFISETDFIVGKLSGTWQHSDFSNMLKFGYDLLEMRWPSFIETQLGIPLEALPEVVPPGTPITAVSSQGSAETRLPTGTPIIAGATDGTAAQISSGAVGVGAWNAALGTTLVLKGITDQLLIDPLQRIYCHRHPEEGWMPGGASNTGADWITADYPGTDPEALNLKAQEVVPTSLLRYPLLQPGERFPFASAQARGFILGSYAEEIEAYAAGLEGVALIEKLAFDTLAEIGAPVTDTIHITGGGARSSLWSHIRASVLDKKLLRPQIAHAGMGAALLAARAVWFNSLQEAVKEIVHIDQEFSPIPEWRGAYQDKYQKFRAELLKRGYLRAVL